jgi:hypothetical protein
MRITSSYADFLIQAGDSGDDGLHFYDMTNSAYHMTISNAGKVGIGTTSPSYALDVNGVARISTHLITPLVDVATNTGIYSQSANTLQFQTGNLERARIDSSGRLLVGTSSGRNVGIGVQVSQQIETAGSTYGGLSITSNRNDADGSYLVFGKSRGTTVGSSTVVQSGDLLGMVVFAGGDGTNILSQAATIEGRVDGTPGASDMPGRLVFSTTADGASSPTERLRIDSSGRVGIGTTSPGALLDVTGSNGKMLIANGTTSDSMRFSAQNATGTGNAVMVFESYNLEYGRFDTSGRLGIGTTNPVSALNVSVADGGNVTISNTNDGHTSGLAFGDTSSNASGRVSYDHFSNAMRFDTAGTEVARIDSSGRLLVGTSSAPTANVQNTSKLIVEGNAGVNPSGPGTLTLARGSAITTDGQYAGEIFFTDTGDGFFAVVRGECDGTPGSGDYPGRLTFSTTADGASSPTERMRITNEGLIQVSNGRLYVQANEASNPLCHAYNTNNAASDITYRSELGAGSNGTSAYHFYGVTGGYGKFAIYGNGTYGTISDQNLKTHIEPARGGYLADLNQIKIVKYGWKSDELGHATELGVIAQEVEQVFPGLVQECPPNEDGEVFKGVKTSVFTFMLIKALQEASSKIESLESRIAALEAS